MNWAIGIDMYTLMGIKLITNKNLLYKKINEILKLKKKVIRDLECQININNIDYDAKSSQLLSKSNYIKMFYPPKCFSPYITEILCT